MKKTLTVFIAVMLILTFCVSCNIRRLDDETAKQVLTEKLPTSYYVMAAVYGDLLKVSDDENIDTSWTTPHYFKVAEDSYYTDIASIKADAEKVFAPNYLETLYEYAFEGNDEQMSRFAENEGVLTMDVVKKPMGILSDIYTETAKVTKTSRYSATVEVECSADGGETRRTAEIKFSYVEDEWMFNGATY